MDVSFETPIQTERRLRRVIANTELSFFQGSFVFEEFEQHAFQTSFNPKALALVRSEDCWSQLVEYEPGVHEDREEMGLWRFRFPVDEDNSGFVGWLASELKSATGTGVLVICGYDKRTGGIFDYWGCPIAVFDQARDKILALTDVKPRS